MVFPKLKIFLNKIVQNTIVINQLCDNNDITITAITKLVCSDSKIVKILIANGIKCIGDSKIDNLKKNKSLEVEKWLIRSPMCGEIESVILYSDISFNTDIRIINMLNVAAEKMTKIHKILLMIEMGDLREGIFEYKEIIDMVKQIKSMNSIQLVGIGTSLGCLSHNLLDYHILNELKRIKKEAELIYKKELPIISSGNSSSIKFMQTNNINEFKINYRLGEVLFLGRERETYRYISNTFDDAFIIETEVIENKLKPQKYELQSSTNQDVTKGMTNRAICAIGKQDIDIDSITPIDESIKIIGITSDHLVLDVTASKRNYKAGDIIVFKLGYGSIMRAYGSPYISKVYIK